jgi:hypothetical protein
VADSKIHADGLRLRAGVSLSQTRFALANFCLSHLGAGGQYFADIIEFCSAAHQLQEVLNAIRADVHARSPELLAALAECVREANDTDGESASPGAPRTGAPPRASPNAPAAASRAPIPPAASPPASGPPEQTSRGSDSGTLRLKPGVSLAQARFALTEFCLDQFGAKAQQLVDAINRCAEIGGLQKILTLIGADVHASHPDSTHKLSECVQEINDTAD